MTLQYHAWETSSLVYKDTGNYGGRPCLRGNVGKIWDMVSLKYLRVIHTELLRKKSVLQICDLIGTLHWKCRFESH